MVMSGMVMLGVRSGIGIVMVETAGTVDSPGRPRGSGQCCHMSRCMIGAHGRTSARSRSRRWWEV